MPEFPHHLNNAMCYKLGGSRPPTLEELFNITEENLLGRVPSMLWLTETDFVFRSVTSVFFDEDDDDEDEELPLL